MSDAVVAERIHVRGIVQGVGFRPFVYRIATELGLTGKVGNEDSSAFIEIQGRELAIAQFLERLVSEAPPLARIESIQRETATCPDSGSEFVIVSSRPGADQAQAGRRSYISPDAATCTLCVAELHDPRNRRFGHAFISCTDCGPRFTIIEDLPYDRPKTTMSPFPMCRACTEEYNDPSDRRFHAQPICCHDCGPTLRFVATGSSRKLSDAEAPADSSPVAKADADPLIAARQALSDGAVLALKGTGGFQLICDARNDAAVNRLRARKQRPDKPFAVMVADEAVARGLAWFDEIELSQLRSAAAPIVLAHSRQSGLVSRFVAPGSPVLGVMLANNPLHHLLLSPDTPALVVTSGNMAGSPIEVRDERVPDLECLVDGVLSHDRRIHVPCDDSVVRVVAGEVLPVRRARGYAPIPLALPGSRRNVLAVGAEMKNAFCLVAADRFESGGRAWMSQHLGEMGNLETLTHFESMIDHFRCMYKVDFDPGTDLLVCDLHPGYLASRWSHNAGSAIGMPVLGVQHHHAHVCAVLAEHQIDPQTAVLGLAFDGTGYGPDGTMWGGEALIVNAYEFERVAHLTPISLPGNDEAARSPFRSALAHLHAAGVELEDDLAASKDLDPVERALLSRQLVTGFGCSTTTSMGRLFDAVASLLGLRQQVSFEAQAAIELEHLACSAPHYDVMHTQRAGHVNRYAFELVPSTRSQPLQFNPGAMLRLMIEDLAVGLDRSVIAWHFHQAVADLTVQLAEQLCAASNIETVVLSGGVFQNALLTELCVSGLRAAQLRPLMSRVVPANDGGLALGQAYVGAHALSRPPTKSPPKDTHLVESTSDTGRQERSAPFVSLLGPTNR